MNLNNNRNRTGITTAGALGVSLIVLVSTGFINPWWLVAGILLAVSAMGTESGRA